MRHPLTIALLLCLAACGNNKPTTQQQHIDSDYQTALIQQGWEYTSLPTGELSDDYGYTPVYGLQDNYFDITIGSGADLVIKIIDLSTDQCIRYVAIPENTTATVSQIPQGIYYLKLALGQDWMERHTDTSILGKFTANVFYEKSIQHFNFGKKNSNDFVNYTLTINADSDTPVSNFTTTDITEKEFFE